MGRYSTYPTEVEAFRFEAFRFEGHLQSAKVLAEAGVHAVYNWIVIDDGQPVVYFGPDFEERFVEVLAP